MSNCDHASSDDIQRSQATIMLAISQRRAPTLARSFFYATSAEPQTAKLQLRFPEFHWKENMPGIRIACVGSDPESANYAAAIMGTTLAKASEPITNLPSKGEIIKPEKTRLKNPNQLTIERHVFPVRSIQQFVNQRWRVSLFDKVAARADRSHCGA